MPYRSISRDMKERALELIEEGWTAEEVADVLHVSGKSIAMEATGSLDAPNGRGGRPRLLTSSCAAVVRFSPIQWGLSKNRRPNHGPVQGITSNGKPNQPERFSTVASGSLKVRT
ncbi:hypothetical protein AZE42_10266 [Rhizopogon vesiculosus]|uniref:Uncharacterized protein n=1 Tax=Rhizopogon vesiculosus TaxID=180088 RepID=A0A1J8QTV8_9AGAM|nr:hypothetical protein AZE42_10266 [Rhizopogon vesiculosus]